MSKTSNYIYVEDYYQTTLQNDLSDSWDLTIQVIQAPINKKWFLVLSADVEANKERVFYDDVQGNNIYVKEINRINPKTHTSWDKIQINDTSLIFKYITELGSSTWYVEKTWDLEIKVWGWPILKWTETISVDDKTLTLSDNNTNYIYYKTDTNEFLNSTSEPTNFAIILSEVITSWWKITQVKYRRHWLFIWNYIESITKTWTNVLTDTYTITYTDWSTSTFNITNGRGITSVTRTWSTGWTNHYRIDYNDNTISTFDVIVPSATWGNIDWTLSDQTDLQDALDNKENTFTKNTAFNKDFWTAAWTVLEWNTDLKNATWWKIDWTLSNQTDLQNALDWKEPTITKNTAFNKDFWTAAWTVLEWNTNVWIVWTKEVDETNLADWNAIQYDSASGQYKSVPFPAWWGGWIETVKISWEQIAWTYYFEYDADSNKTVGNVVIALEVANTGASFIVKCYKNWTDLSKDITIADWWWTAVNGRYKANLDVNESLVADDVFELEIYQVGSNVAGSDFTSLINIS